MGSRVGNRAALQRLRDFLQIEDVKGAPPLLDVDDIKTVAAFQLPNIYEEFFVVTESLFGPGGAAQLTALRVGGAQGNGQGVAIDINTSDIINGSNAGEWDYKIFQSVYTIEFAVAAVEAGNGLTWRWLYRPANGGGEDYEMGAANVNNGNTIDTDEKIYRMGIGNFSASTAGPGIMWPRWIPGFIGNELIFEIQHRTGGTGGPRTPFIGSGTQRLQTWGLRFPKGSFPISG